jgi:hypothetical protein
MVLWNDRVSEEQSKRGVCRFSELNKCPRRVEEKGAFSPMELEKQGFRRSTPVEGCPSMAFPVPRNRLSLPFDVETQRKSKLDTHTGEIGGHE